ncbi:hypothetical protein CCACVL1_01929 [Corchorus capsularis]|uniref:Uncharacterized protein n=1 Tax=Corchorus capsularis TaxID=210143 RepID=A0A1R3KE47_COCAP|nr:hypothetical protein CCACVL1_01929 [Corchorus capsularis]
MEWDGPEDLVIVGYNLRIVDLITKYIQLSEKYRARFEIILYKPI